MRKLSSLLVICGTLAAAVFYVRSARAEETKAPETIVFDKAKLGTVTFKHQEHAKRVGGCDTCHAGKEPIFPKEKTTLKMADMYKGLHCGHCHDGQVHEGYNEGKPVFAAKAVTSCKRCHVK